MEKYPGQEFENTPLNWREPFEWREPEEWPAKSDLIELADHLLTDGRIEAGLALLANRQSAIKEYGWPYALHTPPAAEHYPHTYLWDSGFFMIIYSQAGLFASQAADYLEQRLQGQASHPVAESAISQLRELAQKFSRAGEEEGFWLMDGQKENGFLPNLQYGDGYRWYEIEKVLSLDRVRKSSNYTQPPVIPLAALSVYKSLNQQELGRADLYLHEIYDKLAKFMDFFEQKRSNSAEDPLIGQPEPHETGMDSLRQWDYIKPFRRPRHSEMTQEEADRNTFADGAHFVIRLFERRFIAKGDHKKERELFWANDVAMNGIYFHNLQAMARIAQILGKDSNELHYRDLANRVERAILDKMWQEDPSKVPEPGFYSLKEDGSPIGTITISNLFALVLPRLDERKLGALLDMMDRNFNAPYPLPSDSVNSPEYDPENQEKNRLWRGPTWINTNFYLVEFGLRMQAERDDLPDQLKARCQEWTMLIAEKSNKLIDMNKQEGAGPNGSGAYEHYSPNTGRGQREKVINFGWTWLARFIGKT